MEATD